MANSSLRLPAGDRLSYSSHVVINAMSATGAGGFTVARQLAHYLPEVRPEWKFTLLFIAGFDLHEQVRQEDLPPNCLIHRAPPDTARRLSRYWYERQWFPRLERIEPVSAVLQLNGMMPPGTQAPVLCHNQDPWPYRPEAWDHDWTDRPIAFLRRRAHAKGFRKAASVSFTSNYLRHLMIQRIGVKPRRTAVFYNGLPEDLIARASKPLPSWQARPMELISLSSVGLYKRQELVIRALPQLISRPGCEKLIYRIVGKIFVPEYGEWLRRLARELGVEDRVFFHGRIPETAMQEMLSRARCFVLMSVCESFGLPAIEAMSFGTPVVTSDCCAMPEVCGNAAVLSPVDDLAALVHNLHCVLTDESLAEHLRAAGAQNCRRFRWSETATQMAAELASISQANVT